MLLFLLAACTVSEVGSVEVLTCPNCSEAYEGFSSCAFFDADNASDSMLVDEGNYAGRGIPIYVSGYMHHKFCFNQTHAVFGSANPTNTGLRKNDNLVIRVKSSVFAEGFASEYNYLLGQGDGSYTQKWVFNKQPVELLFCPRSGCEDRLIEVLSEAEESVLFLSFSFTSRPVANQLVELHKQGVCVAGVMESFGAGSPYSRFESLLDEGIAVSLAKGDGLMHHKAFLVDGELSVVGSYNPSASANERNSETLVFLREQVVAQALLSEFFRVGGVLACE